MEESIRAYGRIIWHSNMPVFQMVNPNNKRFTIYTGPILSLYLKKDKFVLVKKKDNEPSAKVGHYQGEIRGILEEWEWNDENYFKITLYIGEPSKTLQINNKNEITEWLEKQEYYFPKDEFVTFIKCIDSMFT